MGITVCCSVSVEVIFTPVSPHPEIESGVKLHQRLTLLTIDVAIQANMAFTNVRKTGRAEDSKIHSLLCRLVH